VPNGMTGMESSLLPHRRRGTVMVCAGVVVTA
jgi:hypothetical protein